MSLTLLDFTGEWCVGCRELEPILHELGRKYGVEVVMVDVEENPMLANRFGVRSLPTLILLRDGVPIGSLVGAWPRERVEEWLREGVITQK